MDLTKGKSRRTARPVRAAPPWLGFCRHRLGAAGGRIGEQVCHRKKAPAPPTLKSLNGYGIHGNCPYLSLENHICELATASELAVDIEMKEVNETRAQLSFVLD